MVGGSTHSGTKLLLLLSNGLEEDLIRLFLAYNTRTIMRRCMMRSILGAMRMNSSHVVQTWTRTKTGRGIYLQNANT
jgi:hypothetical protein